MSLPYPKNNMKKQNKICECGHEEKEHRTYPTKRNKDGFIEVVQVPLKTTKCNHREMGKDGYEDCECKKFKLKE